MTAMLHFIQNEHRSGNSRSHFCVVNHFIYLQIDDLQINNIMKKVFIVIAVMVIIITSAIIACNTNTSPNTDGLDPLISISEDSLIKRGEYLVTIMGCHDCHTPKTMGPTGPHLDSTKMFSGHPSSMPVAKINPSDLQSWVMFNLNLTAFAGPWGISYAANISSDETGIGNWTEEQFFRAIRQGKSKGLEHSRPLLPPMPWEMYRNATDEDLRAIFLYLKSTPPVKNHVPAYLPAEQFTKL